MINETDYSRFILEYLAASTYLFFLLPTMPTTATLAGDCSFGVPESFPIGALVLGSMVCILDYYLVINNSLFFEKLFRE